MSSDSDGTADDGILDSIELNPDGGGPDSRGYLGIELTKAPVGPGTYYLKVAPAGSAAPSYRIRRQSGLVLDNRTDAGEYEGAFALCTVAGGEILDENFQRIDPIPVDGPTRAYVRLGSPSATGNDLSVVLTSRNVRGEVVTPSASVPLQRTGQSSSFIGPITIVPDPFDPDGGGGGARVADSPPATPEIRVQESVNVIANASGEPNQIKGRTSRSVKLKIQWLTENGDSKASHQVTRIVKVPDPLYVGHYLYVEDTWIRVEADAKVTWGVRLEEDKNTDFPSETPLLSTPNWQFTYQGELGVASDFLPAIVPSPQALVVLMNGKTDPIRLRSLAGPRGPRGTGGATVQTWSAKLIACEWVESVPCWLLTDTDMTRATSNVGQWIDQQRYTRHVPGAEFNRSDLPNGGIPDWIEAISWDALSDAPLRGPDIGVVASQIERIEVLDNVPAGADGYAFTDTGQPDRLAWIVRNLDFDAFRWDRELGRLGLGLLTADKTITTAASLHEARHGYQFRVLCPGNDIDGDWLPATPEPIDAMALRLKDGPHESLPGGQNPEGHYSGGGSGQSDLRLFPVLKVPLERDASLFQQRSTQGLLANSVVTNQITRAEVVVGEATLTVQVIGWWGVEVPILNSNYRRVESGVSHVVVELTLPAVLGLTASAGSPTDPTWRTPEPQCLGSQCVGLTDLGGAVKFILTGPAGSYDVTVTARRLVPEGNVRGQPLPGFPKQVTVEVGP